MTLASVVLDDLTFQQMLDASRQRIAPLSEGRWTLHAPVDPGVTLIELYAWALEQRLYFMDQLPDAALSGLLALLGVESHPVRVATGVFQLSRGDGAGVMVPAGSALSLDLHEPPLVFTTSSDVTLLAVERIGASRNARALDDALEQGRLVRLFDAAGTAETLEITLWLAAPPPTDSAAPLGLLLDLELAGSIAPSWSNEAAQEVPAPAALVFGYSTGAGTFGDFAPGAVEDGTGGLRRSGVLRVPVPADWAPAGPANGGLTPYAFRVRTEAATFSAPPRVNQIVPNAVHVEHRFAAPPLETAPDWLPLPGRTLALPRDLGPVIPGRVAVEIVERGASDFRGWQPVERLDTSGPEDRVFVVDRAGHRLEFGDGRTGRQPVLERDRRPNVRVRFEVGGGEAGNLAAGFAWSGRDDLELYAVNPVETSGGAEAEPLERARERAQGALDAVTRAVTLHDHEQLVLRAKGIAIARAHAAAGVHPGHPCRVIPGATTVFVVPDVPAERGDADHAESGWVAAPVPDPGALAWLERYLEERRLIGHEVFVRPARYRDVEVAVEVGAAVADEASLRSAVGDRIATYLDPLRGGDDGTGWPFGDALRPSALLRVAEQAVGSTGEVSLVRVRLEAGAWQDCDDVTIGEHELPKLLRVVVRIRAPELTAGGLR